MENIVYKTNENDERISENVNGIIEHRDGNMWLSIPDDDERRSINLGKGDIIHYSDFDLPINGCYIVVLAEVGIYMIEEYEIIK